MTSFERNALQRLLPGLPREGCVKNLVPFGNKLAEDGCNKEKNIFNQKLYALHGGVDGCLRGGKR